MLCKDTTFRPLFQTEFSQKTRQNACLAGFLAI
jgi:hypothetical protein